MAMNRDRTVRVTVWAAWLMCSGWVYCTVASAQSLEERGFEPVDQMVEDVDPSATSLRRVEPGLRFDMGQRANVFQYQSDQPDAEDDSTYYLIIPGVVATFDRSEYAITRKGKALQLAPPNLVYRLDLSQLPDNTRQPLGGEEIDPEDDARLDYRIGAVFDPTMDVAPEFDEQLDDRMDAVFDATRDINLPAQGAYEAREGRADVLGDLKWRVYLRASQLNRSAVIGAIRSAQNGEVAVGTLPSTSN